MTMRMPFETMRLNNRKAIALVLVTFLIFSLFSFSVSTFAAHEKISTELESKIKNSANSAIPVIVQTQRGLQEKHKTRIQQLGGEIKQDLSLIEGFSADLSAQP